MSVFKMQLSKLPYDGLLLVLEDIKQRIGDGYLSENESYLEDQKEKAAMVMEEMENR